MRKFHQYILAKQKKSMCIKLVSLIVCVVMMSIGLLSGNKPYNNQSHDTATPTLSFSKKTWINFTNAIYGSLSTYSKDSPLIKYLNTPSNLTGSTVTLISGNPLSAGTTGILTFQVTNSAPDDEWIADISITFPTGWTIACNAQDVRDSGTNPIGKSCSTANNVATYTDSGGDIRMNNTWNFSVDVTAPINTPTGIYDFEYTLVGDDYGSAPHSVSATTFGAITVQASGGGGSETTASLICAAGATEINGTVFEDYNYNGIYDASENLGVENVTATAIDSLGNAFSDNTDASGSFTIAGLTAGRIYRMEFTNIPSSANPTLYGKDNGTTVQFVQSGNCANLGVANPADYCLTTATKSVTSCFAPGDPNNVLITNLPAVVSMDYKKVPFNNQLFEVLSPSTGPNEFTFKNSINGAQIFDLTATMVLADDGSGDSDHGCNSLVNSAEINGNIALIVAQYPFTCVSSIMATNAINAGAIGLIIITDSPNGSDDIIRISSGTGIPIISVSKNTGTALLTLVGAANQINMRLQSPDVLTTIGEVGATWGLSFNQEKREIYMASVLKRHAGFGPNGIGAIYRNNLNTGTVDLLYDLGTLAGNGTYSTNSGRGLTGTSPTDATYDTEAFAFAGRAGLGDIDLSLDEQTLWVVNLFNQRIYALATDNPTPGSAVAIPAIPSVGCANGAMRPFGLKVHDAGNGEKVYVGVVCDGEISGNANNVNAYVLAYDPATTTWSSPLLTFPMNYQRQPAGIINFQEDADWRAWTNSYTTMTNDGFLAADNCFAGGDTYPQPILADIEFDDNGDMILGFLDRSGLQIGTEQYRPGAPYGPGGTDLICYISTGDVLRAGKQSTTSWTLENDGQTTGIGGARTHNVSANILDISIPQPSGPLGNNGREFYWGDYYVECSTCGGIQHWETSFGGLAVLPNSNQLLMTAYDASGNSRNAAGFTVLSNINGARIGGADVFNSATDYTFNKGVGLGDVELFCNANPPLEIGNYVWCDSLNNGIQDAFERGIDNLLVQLYDRNGLLVGQDTTSNSGQYYFNQYNVDTTGINVDGSGGTTPVTAWSGMNYSTQYFIVFGSGQFVSSEFTVGSDTYGITSMVNIGSDDNIDSDVHGSSLTTGSLGTRPDGLPFVDLITSVTGCGDHKYDLGVTCTTICDLTLSYSQTSCTDNTDGTFTATYDLMLNWENPPTTGGLNLILYGDGTLNTTTVSAATIAGSSSTTLSAAFTVSADGDGNIGILAAFSNELTCKDSISFKAPTPCPNDVTPCTPTSGCIGGNVFADANCNGTDDTNEGGVQGVEIQIYDCNNILVGTSYSDSDGDWQICSLTDETEYRVESVLPESISCELSPSQVGTDNGSTVQFASPQSCVNLGLSSNDLYCNQSTSTAPTTMGMVQDYQIGAVNGQTITVGSGSRFFDSGGIGNNYTAFEDYAVTFCTDDNSPLIADFTEFAVENHVTCSFDYLEIYDGIDNATPQIGNRYCGYNTPGAVVSSGNCLHFVFHSDDGTEEFGWEAIFSTINDYQTGECSANELRNTGFENDGSTGATFSATFEGSRAEPMPKSQYTVTNQWYNDYGCTDPCPVSYWIYDDVDAVNNTEGDYFVWLAEDSYCIRQEMNQDATKCYRITFDAAAWSNPGPQVPARVVVDEDGVTYFDQVLPASPSWNNLNWQSLSFIYQPGSTEIDNVFFSQQDINGVARGLVIDNVCVQEVNCNPCAISNLNLANTTVCNDNGTASDTDDYYTADVTVTFANAPANGLLVLNGDGNAAIAVNDLGSATSHTFTNVKLVANGTENTLNAFFTNNNTCTFTLNGIAAVNSCSNTTCAAPLEIGNYVWCDSLENGIQDACERGIDNILVSLYDRNGVLVGQDSTANSGQYYFNQYNVDTTGIIVNGSGIATPVTAWSGMSYSTQYFIVFGDGQFASSKFTVGGETYGITPMVNVGANDNIDSDVANTSLTIGSIGTRPDGLPFIDLTTSAIGCGDHKYDLGVTCVPLCSLHSPLISFDYTDEDCENMGTITVIHEDVPLASSYNYEWSNGQTMQTATGLMANQSYTVTITNNDIGCDTIATFSGFTSVTSPTNAVVDNVLNACPGLAIEGNVSWNDTKATEYKCTLINLPVLGDLTFDSTGYFYYEPNSYTCFSDEFTYQICSQGNCCDTAVVFLSMMDTILPQLVNVPADDTIHCDEILAQPPLISAIDNCPAVSIDVTENSTQGEDGCSLYDYTLTRTWTSFDACGNSTSDQQVVEIQDITAPDIFRIYTLPNGKKMVAGVMENVNQNWKTISLPIDFPTKPLIFSQVITTKENTAVTSRIRNVSSAQFELKLQEEEGQDGKHLRENVAWIAIESGNQTTPYTLETQKISLTNAWKTVNFTENHATFPSFFGAIQTVNEKDPAGLRFRNPNLASMQIQLEEEVSSDAEIVHLAEEIAFLGVEHGIDLVDNKGHVFGESGSVSVDEKWITINTQNTYYNPVVIAGIPQHLGGDPGIVRVRNVTASSFDIQFQEWDYRDGGHAFEYVSYLVIEGSLPLDASLICEYGTDSLELGKDIIAIDNCDINVDLQYNEDIVIDGNAKYFIRTWFAADECGNTTGLSQIVPCTGVGLQLKALLQGAMLGNKTYGLMRDDLREKGILPTKEPYSAMSNFDHVGAGGGEEYLPELLDITGEKAIVDWVFVELRQADNQDNVVATQSALLQRDGNVIAPNGDNILYFENLPPDNYYVAIRHRNHLSVETLHPYQFNETNIPFIDFMDNFLPTAGNEVFTETDGHNALWAGDLNQDEKTIYQGPQNDVFRMFLQVLLDSLNQNYLTNFISSGYTESDFNLDGLTIYQGPNNDRSNLLFNTVLNHPNNDINASNFILSTRDNIVSFENCQADKTLPDCDFDGDGKLNRTDSDDDNDGVVDGNDTNPYNPESDSDGDGIKDKLETENSTNPLNACDPYQDHAACDAQDLDGDGLFGNYPSGHSLYDEHDLNACIPNSQAANCGCADAENDGYIFVCHTTEKGQKQTLKITLEQWRLRQATGDSCGACPN